MQFDQKSIEENLKFNNELRVAVDELCKKLKSRYWHDFVKGLRFEDGFVKILTLRNDRETLFVLPVSVLGNNENDYIIDAAVSEKNKFAARINRSFLSHLGEHIELENKIIGRLEKIINYKNNEPRSEKFIEARNVISYALENDTAVSVHYSVDYSGGEHSVFSVEIPISALDDSLDYKEEMDRHFVRK